MGFRDLGLKAKIILGSSTTLALLIVLGVIAYSAIGSLLKSSDNRKLLRGPSSDKVFFHSAAGDCTIHKSSLDMSNTLVHLLHNDIQ